MKEKYWSAYLSSKCVCGGGGRDGVRNFCWLVIYSIVLKRKKKVGIKSMETTQNCKKKINVYLEEMQEQTWGRRCSTRWGERQRWCQVLPTISQGTTTGSRWTQSNREGWNIKLKSILTVFDSTISQISFSESLFSPKKIGKFNSRGAKPTLFTGDLFTNNFANIYCFDSLAIRLRSKDLRHLTPRTGLQG